MDTYEQIRSLKRKIEENSQLIMQVVNIVNDTTPQLGGDLDLNAHNIDFPSVVNISDCKDEDDMASDSATMLATQQSIKAYADTKSKVATGSYTGNAANNRQITGFGFTPKFAFVSQPSGGDIYTNFCTDQFVAWRTLFWNTYAYSTNCFKIIADGIEVNNNEGADCDNSNGTTYWYYAVGD